jgi:histidinol dehydrogenase
MEIRLVDLRSATRSELNAFFSRAAVPDHAVRAAASNIVSSVRFGGDAAVLDAAERYGGGRKDGSIRVPDEELRAALDSLDPSVSSALETAASNVRACHLPQRPTDSQVQVGPGISIRRVWTPLRRVGVYVPGGGAAYPSSLLMGVIPARIAGVGEVVVASPADQGGRHPQAVLAAAAMLEVDEFYSIGGAQAIGALAYGTQTVAAVDKVVGPGSVWVTAAKLAIYGECAVDLPAGPSEALVIADSTADPVVVAADVLCQAEHGEDSPVVLVTTAPAVLGRVLDSIEKQLSRLERAQILRTALSKHGAIVLAPDIDAAVEFANRFAPEHCSVHTADAPSVAERIVAAGSVFVGHWSPESAGDYASGANHILPTGGLAKAHGPLGVEDFGSWRQIQELTEQGLASLRGTIATLAATEGLTAHRNAVEIRFGDGT